MGWLCHGMIENRLAELKQRMFSKGIKSETGGQEKVSKVVVTMKPLVSNWFHRLKPSVSLNETILKIRGKKKEKEDCCGNICYESGI